MSPYQPEFQICNYSVANYIISVKSHQRLNLSCKETMQAGFLMTMSNVQHRLISPLMSKADNTLKIKAMMTLMNRDWEH